MAELVGKLTAFLFNMATIFTKGSEKTCILSPREGLMRQFDFGSWTELRLGFFYSIVSSSNNDAAGPTESIVTNNEYDLLALGLKTYNSYYPRQVGCNFVGITSQTTGCTKNASNIQTPTGSNHVQCSAYKDATNVSTLSTNDIGGLAFPSDPSVGSNYSAFWGIRYVINNRGLSTQTISIYLSTLTPVSDVSVSNLLTRLNAFPVAGTNAPRILTFNDGVNAHTVPDAIFLRLPFYNNRLRISAYRLVS